MAADNLELTERDLKLLLAGVKAVGEMVDGPGYCAGLFPELATDHAITITELGALEDAISESLGLVQEMDSQDDDKAEEAS